MCMSLSLPARESQACLPALQSALMRVLVAAYSYLVIASVCATGVTRMAAMTIEAFKLKYVFMQGPCCVSDIEA